MFYAVYCRKGALGVGVVVGKYQAMCSIPEYIYKAQHMKAKKNNLNKVDSFKAKSGASRTLPGYITNTTNGKPRVFNDVVRTILQSRHMSPMGLRLPATRLTSKKPPKLRITLWEPTADRWIPTKGQLFGKRCHVMTSSCGILHKQLHFSQYVEYLDFSVW